jgi:CRISPR-associated protein Csd1
MRAVLTGERYPRTLLTAALGRLRAGDDPGSGWHAAVIKAVLARDLRKIGSKEKVPMSLDRENPDPAYHLGRLFAAMETAQRLAIPGVNATIRDRYFGAASAAPATIFPLLLRGVQNHLGKLRKDHKSGWLEREIDEISSHVRTFPPTLPLKKQGLFVLGYYHQRQGQFAKKDAQHDLEKMEKGEDGDVGV